MLSYIKNFVQFILATLILIGMLYSFTWIVNTFNVFQIAGEHFNEVSLQIPTFNDESILAFYSFAILIICYLFIFNIMQFRPTTRAFKILFIAPFFLTPILTFSNLTPFKTYSDESIIEFFYTGAMNDIIIKNNGVFPDSQTSLRFINYRDNNLKDGIDFYISNKNNIVSIDEIKLQKINALYTLVDDAYFKESIYNIELDNVITVNEYSDFKNDLMKRENIKDVLILLD